MNVDGGKRNIRPDSLSVGVSLFLAYEDSRTDFGTTEQIRKVNIKV